MSSLKDFLLEARKTLQSGEPFVFVVGNESADLDSVISAICLAYLWLSFNGKPLIPVVNNKKCVLEMRGEVIYALSILNINLEELLYFDDLTDKFEAVLVDHNEPSLKWNSFDYRILAIIDHHHDSGLFPEASPRLIATCASTCSLLINIAGDKLESIKPLLEVTIVYDTINWTWRVSDFDLKMGRELLSHVGNITQNDLNFKFAPVMAKLEASIIDEYSINPLSLVYKDYKEYKCNNLIFGISVIHIPLQIFLKEGHRCNYSLDIPKSFILSNKIDFLIIMSAVREAGNYNFYQQFSLFSYREDITSHLAEELNHPLELEKINFTHSAKDNIVKYIICNQNNLQISRKKLVPMIIDIIRRML